MNATDARMRAHESGGATTVDEHWPHWVREFNRLSAVAPQFVISGNIRDLYLTPTEDGLLFLTMADCLYESLANRGCRFLFIYDQIDGIRVHPTEMRAAATRSVPDVVGGRTDDPLEIDDLPGRLRAVASAREVPCAFVVDYASRLVSQPQDLADAERTFFAACEKVAHETTPLRTPDPSGAPQFNPIIWLTNRRNDLPDWFVVGNEAIREITASLPDRDTRVKAAEKLAGQFAAHDQLDQRERKKSIDRFADSTERETLRSMMAITQLAREQGTSLAEVSDAVRLYQLGLPDNPWAKADLRDRLREPEGVIHRRVKGQRGAVRKSMDILIRSVMGLSGAQASARGARPRGVLFFAGPTGVGKTELAKAITELILGDEKAYRRFDMSEFSSRQSEARLIGSPPGYVGHDAGGELVGAIRERPFSVLLFDEIEKAHPRILDKFLQILEDGRLTDGRGETAHFSEAVVIFTSNLGIYGPEEDGVRVPKVSPDMAPEKVEEEVRKAIEDHFRYNLERPEILNRLGDNIVVFNFIGPEVAKEIFEMMLNNVVNRVKREISVDLTIPDEWVSHLRDLCTSDLTNGGRGIGNRLETDFINPLAVALYNLDLDDADGGLARVAVQRISRDEDNNICTVALEVE